MNLNEAKNILLKAGYLCEDAYMDAMDAELDEIQDNAARTTSKGYKMTYLDSFETAKKFAKYANTERPNDSMIFTQQSFFRNYRDAGYKTFVFTNSDVDNPGEPTYKASEPALKAFDKFGCSLFIIHIKHKSDNHYMMEVLTRYTELDADNDWAGTLSQLKFDPMLINAVLKRIVKSKDEFADLVRPHVKAED